MYGQWLAGVRGLCPLPPGRRIKGRKLEVPGALHQRSPPRLQHLQCGGPWSRRLGAKEVLLDSIDLLRSWSILVVRSLSPSSPWLSKDEIPPHRNDLCLKSLLLVTTSTSRVSGSFFTRPLRIKRTPRTARTSHSLTLCALHDPFLPPS